MRFLLSLVLTLSLALPTSMGMLIASTTSAEAASYGSSFRATSFRSPSYRSTPRVYTPRSYTSKTTTFKSVRDYSRTGTGLTGNNTMLYALAYMAILNSQSTAAEQGTSVRDTNAAATYGITNPTPKSMMPAYFILSIFGFFIIALFVMMFAPMIPRRHSDYY